MGAWAQTLTGRAFDYARPKVSRDHFASEIAPCLGKIVRFSGHAWRHYSVAQHSVICAEAALIEIGDTTVAAYALLHDAHEAYLGDTTSPAKAALLEELEKSWRSQGLPEAEVGLRLATVRNARRQIEARLDREIFAAAGLSYDRFLDWRKEIHELDIRALHAERDALMDHPPRRWETDTLRLPPLPLREDRIEPLSWQEAERSFLEIFNRLCPA